MKLLNKATAHQDNAGRAMLPGYGLRAAFWARAVCKDTADAAALGAVETRNKQELTKAVPCGTQTTDSFGC